MLAPNIIQDILKLVKKVSDETEKSVDYPRFKVDMNGWDLNFYSRTYSTHIRVCCQWQVKPGTMDVYDKESKSYLDEMRVVDEQYNLLQKNLNNKLSKSKYSNMDLTVQFSAGI